MENYINVDQNMMVNATVGDIPMEWHDVRKAPFSIRIQPEVLKRRDVVMASYLKARQAGDENVYFIDGMSFFSGEYQHEYTVDGVHPNDAGFLCMAEGIGAVIRHILEKEADKQCGTASKA